MLRIYLDINTVTSKRSIYDDKISSLFCFPYGLIASHSVQKRSLYIVIVNTSIFFFKVTLEANIT